MENNTHRPRKKSANKKVQGRKRRSILPVFLILILVVLCVGAFFILRNRMNVGYENLSETDQKILTELNQCFDVDSETPFWDGYDLHEKTIVAVNGRFGDAYIINPQTEIHSVFAAKISMPDDDSLAVYRITAIAPQLLQFRSVSNFNVTGKDYSLFGNEVFFTRYTDASVADTDFNSSHYITFLAHEAFHYYMQKNWASSGRFDTENMTDTDLDLLAEEYSVLEKMQQTLVSDSSDQETLRTLCRDYIAVVEKRQAANSDYVTAELRAETEEGTATYIGIKASDAAGYPFDVMCFEQEGQRVEHMSFETLIPSIKDGTMVKYAIASDFVYQSGALLCQVLDAIEADGWQEMLNRQTEEAPLTLYDVVKYYTET